MTTCHHCGQLAEYATRTTRTGQPPEWACEKCAIEIWKAKTELMSLPPEELQYVSFTVMKWQCSVEGCCRFTRVKDYSCTPYYRWRDQWVDLSKQIFYCAKHWQYFKRVPKRLKHRPGPGEHHLIENSNTKTQI